ncbi:DNA mismatch endonuclease Vsr [Acidithiobacillus thiooxidans]|nr:DNA mismatch endonuclease Vsr [Acidithiobacillus thiooxidans]
MRAETTSVTDTTQAHSDVLTPEQRSRCMSRIRGKDTSPEMIVRSLVFSMGYRYRLHDRRLPGSPDLVFKSRRQVIFVHGCFWHMHNCRYGQVRPKANANFWETKRNRNVQRDLDNLTALKAAGWTHLVIWECEMKDSETLRERIRGFLL